MADMIPASVGFLSFGPPAVLHPDSPVLPAVTTGGPLVTAAGPLAGMGPSPARIGATLQTELNVTARTRATNFFNTHLLSALCLCRVDDEIVHLHLYANYYTAVFLSIDNLKIFTLRMSRLT
jgi:hypothetical protein